MCSRKESVGFGPNRGSIEQSLGCQTLLECGRREEVLGRKGQKMVPKEPKT